MPANTCCFEVQISCDFITPRLEQQSFWLLACYEPDADSDFGFRIDCVVPLYHPPTKIEAALCEHLTEVGDFDHLLSALQNTVDESYEMAQGEDFYFQRMQLENSYRE